MCGFFARLSLDVSLHFFLHMYTVLKYNNVLGYKDQKNITIFWVTRITVFVCKNYH